MEKEFVPYEQALALKELGFNEPCFATYVNKNELDYHTKAQMQNNVIPINSEYTKESKWISVPLYSQAFRWLRNEYGYFSSPTESDDGVDKKYDWMISKNLGDGKMFINFIGYHNSYEEADLECLKKLIEIVKNK